MRHMLSALNKVKDALLTVSDNVYHYTAHNQTDKYIVWAEDNESRCVQSDNRKIQQGIEGTIDYFTKSENDGTVDDIQTALNTAEIPYRLNSIQYEDETGYIHYEWVFEVVC